MQLKKWVRAVMDAKGGQMCLLWVVPYLFYIKKALFKRKMFVISLSHYYHLFSYYGKVGSF